MTNLERFEKYASSGNYVGEEVYAEGQYTIDKEWAESKGDILGRRRSADTRIPNTTIYTIYEDDDSIESFNTLGEAKAELKKWI